MPWASDVNCNAILYPFHHDDWHYFAFEFSFSSALSFAGDDEVEVVPVCGDDADDEESLPFSDPLLSDPLSELLSLS
jgi:hypothetical protein